MQKTPPVDYRICKIDMVQTTNLWTFNWPIWPSTKSTDSSMLSTALKASWCEPRRWYLSRPCTWTRRREMPSEGNCSTQCNRKRPSVPSVMCCAMRHVRHVALVTRQVQQVQHSFFMKRKIQGCLIKWRKNLHIVAISIGNIMVLSYCLHLAVFAVP